MSAEWVEAISTAVGAGATVILALLTAWTLCVLWGYARDTKRIAETSNEQLESSQTPFIVLVKGELRVKTIAYRLENQGSGPAINVQGWIQWGSEEREDFPRKCIGKGGSIDFEALENFKSARFEYQSVSGREYVTEMDAYGVTKFIRVPVKGLKTYGLDLTGRGMARHR
jgi:hypothetical protein